MDAKLITVNGKFTIGITGSDLTQDDGFDTAINLSLFTDKRASDDRIQEEVNNKGSLHDLVSKVQGRKHGSLLWLLDMARLTPATRNDAATYAQQALNWFVEDGLAKSVIAIAEIVPRSGIRLQIVITYNNGQVSTRYRNLWELTGNAA